MFLVFEGIDGSGKSTQAAMLEKHLREKNHLEVVLLREPGGTRLGEGLRKLLLDPKGDDLAPETEMFLFMAARAHLVRTRIIPDLRAGRVVICDRFVWSTVAYQGTRGGLLPREVLRIGRLAAPGLSISHTFLIDVDPEVSFSRMRARDRMERRGLEFQHRVRSAYLELAQKYRGRVTVIDGGATPRQVHARVLEHLPTHGWSRCSSRS